MLRGIHKNLNTISESIVVVCIKCRAPLAPTDGCLNCTACGASYTVRNGIPRFVSDDGYSKNFSLEWQIHRQTQVDDGKDGFSHHNFNTRFGLPSKWWRGKRVLDVGVGVGRYAQVPIQYGAEVHGIDLSYAVDVAKSNFPSLHVYQADIFKLPFAPGSFDAIYSFGVLHHTPNPRAAFDALLPLLKPGGIICITVYENRGMYHTSRYLRKATTRLPPALLYSLCAAYTALMYVPYRYLGLRYGFLGRFAPISLSDNPREAVLDTFDCYSPTWQFTYGDDEIFSWFKQNNLIDIEVRPQPVTLLGYKPAS
jgi:SAM-dependent methyltransferase